jgi:hypothetical protein
MMDEMSVQLKGREEQASWGIDVEKLEYEPHEPSRRHHDDRTDFEVPPPPPPPPPPGSPWNSSVNIQMDNHLSHQSVSATAGGGRSSKLLRRPASRRTSSSSFATGATGDPNNNRVPLEKVRNNYRSLKRRGATVHSQLLKSAFEASMCVGSVDDSDGDDDSLMVCSNSTIASRDGVEEILTPRKRMRKLVGMGGVGSYSGGSARSTSEQDMEGVEQTSELFGALCVQQAQQQQVPKVVPATPTRPSTTADDQWDSSTGSSTTEAAHIQIAHGGEGYH